MHRHHYSAALHCAVQHSTAHRNARCTCKYFYNYTYGTDDSTQSKYHQNAIEALKNGECDYDFFIEEGRKYLKIVMDARGSKSVHAFVDKKTGEVYKAASYKAPAKGVRFDLRLIEQREWLLENADWAGSYLYAR